MTYMLLPWLAQGSCLEYAMAPPIIIPTQAYYTALYTEIVAFISRDLSRKVIL